MRRFIGIALAALLLLGACAGKATPGQIRTATAGRISMPRAGAYVYELHGGGSTEVPQGATLTDTVTVSGDTVTTVVTNNQNANTRRFDVRWELGRVEQLNNELNIKGSKLSCTSQPAFVLFHNPVRKGRLPTQTWPAGSCFDKVEVEVLGQETITSADGRRWQTWHIESVKHSTGPSRTTTDESWLSPQLGRDVKTETTIEEADFVQKTITLLADYPA